MPTITILLIIDALLFVGLFVLSSIRAKSKNSNAN